MKGKRPGLVNTEALWARPIPEAMLKSRELREQGLVYAQQARQHIDPSANSADQINQLNAALSDFMTRHTNQLSSLEAAVDEQHKMFAAMRLGGVFHGGEPIDDPDYTGAFASYVRKGDAEADLRHANAEGQRARIHAAMSVGTNDQGGYMAPAEWDRRIRKAQLVSSPMRQLASVVITTVQAYTTVWNAGSWGSGWAGETASRPATGTPNLAQITFGHGEIYSNPAITQRLLDDADFNVEDWLIDELDTEFSRQENIAFLSGDGSNKPRGLLTFIGGGASDNQHPGGNLVVVASGHATTLGGSPVDTLIDFAYSLSAPYRQNSTWLMNSSTAATISKLKDGNGNLIWRESLMVDQPSTLLGRPVEIDEGMPSIGAGNIPIAFGDFKAGYLINDRSGSTLLRDPYTNKPYVHFYTTKRVGAGLLDPNAIRLLKIAAS